MHKKKTKSFTQARYVRFARSEFSHACKRTILYILFRVRNKYIYIISSCCRRIVWTFTRNTMRVMSGQWRVMGKKQKKKKKTNKKKQTRWSIKHGIIDRLDFHFNQFNFCYFCFVTIRNISNLFGARNVIILHVHSLYHYINSPIPSSTKLQLVISNRSFS